LSIYSAAYLSIKSSNCEKKDTEAPDVHSPMKHLSLGTVCLQKSCCAIRNILFNSCHQTVWPIPHQHLCSLL